MHVVRNWPTPLAVSYVQSSHNLLPIDGILLDGLPIVHRISQADQMSLAPCRNSKYRKTKKYALRLPGCIAVSECQASSFFQRQVYGLKDEMYCTNSSIRGFFAFSLSYKCNLTDLILVGKITPNVSTHTMLRGFSLWQTNFRTNFSQPEAVLNSRMNRHCRKNSYGAVSTAR